MSFMTRLSKSYQLFKDSYAFLQNNKDLMILPLVSTVATILFFISIFFFGVFSGASVKALIDAPLIIKIIGLGAFNFLLSTIVFYFNTALVVAATMRLRGEQCSVSMALKVASSNWDKIVAWSFVNVTVGSVLSYLQRSHSLIRRLVTFVLGLVWAMASFFVIPMLVFEQVGPIEALKRGSKLFVGNWKQTVSVNMVLFFILVPIFLLIMLLFNPIAAATGSIYIASFFSIMMVMVVSVISNTFDSVVRCALYLKFRHNQIPRAFDGELLSEVFERKEK